MFFGVLNCRLPSRRRDLTKPRPSAGDHRSPLWGPDQRLLAGVGEEHDQYRPGQEKRGRQQIQRDVFDRDLGARQRSAERGETRQINETNLESQR